MISLDVMNSRSFLLFSIFFIFIVDHSYSTKLLAQQKEDIAELKKVLYYLNDKKDFNGCLFTLIKILELDSTDFVVKKQLKSFLRNNLDQLSEVDELIEKSLQYFENYCDLPLFNLAIYYLNKNDFNKANFFSEYLLYCGADVTKSNLSKLLTISSGLSNDKIIKIVTNLIENSDTIIKLYSAYLYYQLMDNYSNKLDYIIKTLKLDEKFLLTFYKTNYDSVYSFFVNYMPNFKQDSYVRFKSALLEKENKLSYQITDSQTDQKSFSIRETDSLYNNDTSLGFQRNNTHHKNPNKNSIKFAQTTNGISLDQRIRILTDRFMNILTVEEIYALVKIFYENNFLKGLSGWLNDSYLRKIYDKRNSNLIPVVFLSFLTGQDNMLKKYSKDFFLSADQKSLNKMREEYLWWKNKGLNVEFISKALELFGDEFLFDNEENTSKEIQNIDDENYYALLIAIQDYEDDNYDLKYPVNDADKLKKILIENYSFNSKNIISLYNPKRSEIIKKFTELKKILKKNDNLLIFYAGHGNWDEITEQGYWLPADAKPHDLSEVLTNSEITAFIKSIKNRHTLLISDACFSGSIFKTREIFFDNFKDIEFYENKDARKAITSGALTPVPDKSIFIEYLLKSLKNNNKKYITSEELFLNFREAVINNSPLNQRPLFGKINDAGDQGGDFIFKRK